MITFHELGRAGRLGNQLYQYALLKGVSAKTGHPIHLPDLSKRVWHGQQCKLGKLNLKYDILDPSKIQYAFNQPCPPSHTFYPEVFTCPPNTNFHGFFQNSKYFDFCREELLEDFSAKSSIRKKAKEIIAQYNNPTSIHVRLGDYITASDMKDFRTKEYPRLVLEYIYTACEKLPSNTDFLVFTGGSRKGNDDRQSDFDWCRERIKLPNLHFMEGNDEILDFELIKHCKNNIMGWDTTFSWWASYLNEQGGRIFCTNKHPLLTLDKIPSWEVL